MQKTKKTNVSKLVLFSLATFLTFGAVIASNQPTNTYAEEDNRQSEEVVSLDTSWKYLDDNTDPANGDITKATDWTNQGFNDAGWKTAIGKFGAKNGKISNLGGDCTPTVLLNHYINGTNGNVIPTYFFRTTFNVTNIDKITSISGSLKADDGVIVYLNGIKVVEDNMNTDGRTMIVEPNMYYAGNSKGDPVQKDFSLTSSMFDDILVSGENTLAVELHNDRESSSDIYLEFTSLKLNSGEDVSVTQKAISLQVGKDETERNLTWYANTSVAGEVQVAKKENMVGNEFPLQYQTYNATNQNTNDGSFFSNQVSMINLDANTEYVYRVVNETIISDYYTFKTGNYGGGFNFLLAGDPQVGASGNATGDADNWQNTLEKTVSKFQPDFILSVGDQVNTASNETQYAGYLQADEIKTTAGATTIGNHDSGSIAYSEHFNLPNTDETKGVTTAGANYWYIYNNTLFMNINSNNRSTAEHKAFMEEAIASNPDVRWKTVVFHHSVYSSATHASDSDIIQRRNELPLVFEELEIDVVLMGHDHVYTRTYMMNGLIADISRGVESSVLDPTGILYLTANSASGSKYYNLHDSFDTSYAAVKDQSKTRTITNIEVTENSYTMTTYYVDTMEEVDVFTINKTPMSGDITTLQEIVDEYSQLKEAEYTKVSWQPFALALDNANDVLREEYPMQDNIDQALTDLVEARNGLVKVKQDLPTKPNASNTTSNGTKVNTGDATDVIILGIVLLTTLGGIIVMKEKTKQKINKKS